MEKRSVHPVVLIDDEPVIVRGLAAAVDWGQYGCRIAGTACDGGKGLELIRSVRPDIVITDICMPHMDGLTMIAALRSEYPDMRITILTGYRDFEYARTALTLGVDRFLLKPSRMDELTEAIRFMTSKLDGRRVVPADGAPERAVPGDDTAEKITPGENMPEKSGTSEQDATEEKAGSFIVHAALDYMKEHYSEHLLLSDVAEHIYVSQWHLSKLLNRETGKKYSDLLNGLRIEKAKEFLGDPAMTIADIARRVGYADLTNFSRVFRHMTGMSASEYRNRYFGGME